MVSTSIKDYVPKGQSKVTDSKPRQEIQFITVGIWGSMNAHGHR